MGFFDMAAFDIQLSPLPNLLPRLPGSESTPLITPSYKLLFRSVLEARIGRYASKSMIIHVIENVDRAAVVAETAQDWTTC